MPRPLALLPLALALATAAHAGGTDQSADPVCTTVDDCLRIVTSRHVHPEHRYYAKRFLDAHPTPEVVVAIAPLVSADLRKLRDLAWWYASSHPQAFAAHLAEMAKGVSLLPEYASVLAAIGGERAWEPLVALLGTLPDPEPAASALRHLDATRASELAFSLIAGEGGIRAPDPAIRGLFDRAGSDVSAVVARLEAIVVGDGPVEARRRAAVALHSALGTNHSLPERIVTAYPAMPASVQRQLRLGFPSRVGTPQEHADDLPALLRDDPRHALAWAIHSAGPAAAAHAPAFVALLDHPDSDLRQFSQRALFAIAPEVWRQQLPRLAASADIEVVLEAREIAEEVDPDTLAIAIAAGRDHWYPKLEQAWGARQAALRDEATEFAAREANSDAGNTPENDGLLSPIELPGFSIYAEACPGDSGESAGPGESLLTPEAMIAEAATHADVDSWHLGAALRFSGGWLSGGSRRQHELHRRIAGGRTGRRRGADELAAAAAGAAGRRDPPRRTRPAAPGAQRLGGLRRSGGTPLAGLRVAGARRRDLNQICGTS
ncbi:hypothetical protein [Arenimonas composti]|uniref:hypothetical protein n=1 Tax=Arenimonas composti TaxID=370776 RepID=UPI0003FEA00C|nr:hypothetical protein [Arenimonas composti]